MFKRIGILVFVGAMMIAPTLKAERDTAIYRGKLTSDMNANGFGIAGLANPTNESGAATKGYVDEKDNSTLLSAFGYTDDSVAAATNGIRNVDGAAHPLPKYLHELAYDATYPEDVAALRGALAGRFGCSARRNGNTFERNYDLHLDETAEFVVWMSAVGSRFASLGVANVGTNLTEQFVTSGKPSRWYKVLPSIMLDGVNENGVVCEVNVTDGEWGRTIGEIHCLEAVRWALDNGTSAGMVASNLAEKVYIPQGMWNFHWMVADAAETWIVEDCAARKVTGVVAVMTNFSEGSAGGEGHERYSSLIDGATITSQWWTAAYDRNTRPIRVSDIGENYESVWAAWESATKEEHRAQGGWWQTLHTSVYDITNRVLRVAVQETDDWYVFALSSGGGKVKSVNGMTGEVVIDIPTIPSKWALANVTNAQGQAVGAADVGAYDRVDGVSINEDDKIMVYVPGATNYRTIINGSGIDTTGFVKCDWVGLYSYEYNCDVVMGSDGIYFDVRGGDDFSLSYPRHGGILAVLDDIPTSFSWSSITGKPTTLAGYGIENAYTKTETEQKIAELAPAPGNYAAVSNAAMNAVANDADYANVKAKALNSAQYYEYGWPFLGRQDLMVKNAMVVGTTNYAQRAQHTEYCDGSIQNEAIDCYLYLPYGKAGNIAVEDPFEVSRLMSIAETNAAAKAATCSAICTVTAEKPHFEIIDGEIHIVTITEGVGNEE